MLFERYERSYSDFARSLSDPSAADDLLQDVWLAVVRNAAGYVAAGKVHHVAVYDRAHAS